MKMEHILIELEKELARAKKIHPKWSLDPIHGAAIVAEEAGSVAKAALDYYYGRAGSHQLKTELVHTLTMAVRFLLSFEKSEQWVIKNLGLREAKNGRKL